MAETGGLDFDRWAQVSEEQLGVNAVDVQNHKIGPNIAKRTGVGLNWYPLDRYQHVLVGEMDHYNFYDGYGAEADWNLFIKPSPEFAFLLDDALPNADPDDLHECQRSDGYCMEAEVTPDEHYYGNPFFPKNGSSPLVGHDIGVYGPWVAEEAHGWRPEIHPSQAIWWRDPAAGGPAGFDLHDYHLLVVQDDSNRFDRTDNFSGTIVRPWSKPPIDIIFRIAVRVPAGQIVRLTVSELYERDAHAIGSSAADSSLELNPSFPLWLGRTGVQVHLASDPRHVAVAFESFTERARFRKSEGFRGYVSLRCRVGTGDRGGEGVLALLARESIVSQTPVVSA